LKVKSYLLAILF